MIERPPSSAVQLEFRRQASHGEELAQHDAHVPIHQAVAEEQEARFRHAGGQIGRDPGLGAAEEIDVRRDPVLLGKGPDTCRVCRTLIATEMEADVVAASPAPSAG